MVYMKNIIIYIFIHQCTIFSKRKYAKVLDYFELFKANILSPKFQNAMMVGFIINSIDIFSASCFFLSHNLTI